MSRDMPILALKPKVAYWHVRLTLHELFCRVEGFTSWTSDDRDECIVICRACGKVWS